MQFKKIKKKILHFLGNNLITPVIIILCKTLRINEVNKSKIDELISNNRNIVFAFWHGTMLVPWYLLKHYSPYAIVSQSKDGSILVNVLNKWNYKVERGSSSKDGKEVLEKLIYQAQNNNTIAITPDGPRGPEKVMKAGAVIIAKKAAVPLVLIGVGYNKKRVLRSWDSFEIPKFFSKTKIVYSEPIYIDKNLDFDQTNNIIIETSKKLNELQKKAKIDC
jgi:hypothetical protein